MFLVAEPVVVKAGKLPSRRRHSRTRLRLRLPPKSLIVLTSVGIIMILFDLDVFSPRHNRRSNIFVMAQNTNNLQQPSDMHNSVLSNYIVNTEKSTSAHSLVALSSSNPSESMSPYFVRESINSTSSRNNDNHRRRGRCMSRCGLGLGGHMRKINAATDGCRQRCSLLPWWFSRTMMMMGWECGTCADWQASFPGFDMQLTVVASADLQPAFYNAASKWSSAITGDLPSVDTRGLKDSSTCPAADIPNVIDDIYICGAVSYIDGDPVAF